MKTYGGHLSSSLNLSLWLLVASSCVSCNGNGGPAMHDAGADDGSDHGPMVETKRGPVLGSDQDGVLEFLGIPYAAPPVGALRWRPPVEPDAWDAPLVARSPGAACPQSKSSTGEELAMSEDCLRLNVWTPSIASSANTPVMVFLHGGAFRRGAARQSLYDGKNLARAGNIVLVTLDYRLGALGFLAHPSLSAENEQQSSGNYGLLDQQAALRWVQDNIAGFGGDPGQVTVFGESAGAMSICAHLASPLAEGLFQRALLQSGPCTLLTTPIRVADETAPSAEAVGEAFATAVGCDLEEDIPACLRAQPFETLLAADAGSNDFDSTRFFPNIDGIVLPQAPWNAMVSGQTLPLDAFLAGSNQDEATLFTREQEITTEAEFDAAIEALAPAHVAEAKDLYPPKGGPYATMMAAYQAFLTDFLFTCPTRAETRFIAEKGTPAYLYFFTKLTPAGVASGLGAFHGSELPLVLGNSSKQSEAELALSALMMNYWTNFGASGHPTSSGGPTWPERTSSADSYLELGTVVLPQNGLHAAQCDVIETWLTTPASS